eukprot:SAG25_NODE_7152_length_501_cov_0.967662_1_plen_74_part_10
MCTVSGVAFLLIRCEVLRFCGNISIRIILAVGWPAALLELGKLWAICQFTQNTQLDHRSLDLLCVVGVLQLVDE